MKETATCRYFKYLKLPLRTRNTQRFCVWCVCERERERERGRDGLREGERESARARQREIETERREGEYTEGEMDG